MARVSNRVLVPGQAAGKALVLGQSLSFWGGVDPDTGAIIDQHHPQSGIRIGGCILVMPSGRGSSSSSSVLVEMIRRQTNPVAIILAVEDSILLLGALVARELYSRTVPVLVASHEEFSRIRSGERLVITDDGTIERSS